MADDRKVKKTKKRKEDEGAGSSKVKRSGSNIFTMFPERQVAEFKEAFRVMDADNDGIISKHDIRATFDAVGRMVNDKELDLMIGEASGPLNFTMFLTLFANRMSVSVDEDDVIINAIKSFDEGGNINSERLRQGLMTGIDKFSAEEVDEAFKQITVDDYGKIGTPKLIQMLTSSAD